MLSVAVRNVKEPFGAEQANSFALILLKCIKCGYAANAGAFDSANGRWVVPRKNKFVLLLWLCVCEVVGYAGDVDKRIKKMKIDYAMPCN